MRLGDIITLNSPRTCPTSYLQAHSLDTPVVGKKTTTHGLSVTIEHPKGSLRILHDDQGKVVYKQHLHHSYGFFNGTKGRDGDETDCFIGPLKSAPEVYVISMKDLGPVKKEREDEDKVMIGFPSADAAKAAFLLHYPKSFFGAMTSLPLADFKKKLRSASLPFHKRKIHASSKCPHCGGKKIVLMPTDFETAKCKDCGKLFEINAKLKTGSSKKTIGENIAIERRAGKPEDQAIAIAYDKAGKSRIKAGGPGSGRHIGNGKIVNRTSVAPKYAHNYNCRTCVAGGKSSKPVSGCVSVTDTEHGGISRSYYCDDHMPAHGEEKE